MDENHLQQTRNVLKTCIQEQCDEVEMLQSIFCNAGEMKISDHSILTDMFDYLEGRRDHLNRKLDYAISILIPNSDNKLELQFELPLMYPAIEQPLLTVRLSLHLPNKLQIENELKRKIFEYIDSDEVDKSSVYIYTIIAWLQENLMQILNNASISFTKSKNSDDHSASIPVESSVEMERLWIYSHHLKSSTKRADILKLANDLNLTGFSKPGKPGIICVEGQKENTQEFWKCIRQWAWQRITLRITESKLKSKSKCDQFRRFSKFRETMGSIDDSNELNSAVPVNMSDFMKFLEIHHCGYVKRELFQLD